MQEFENGLEKKWEFDNNVPFDSNIDLNKLKKFLKKEDVLIFYGGEPLIMIEKIKEIMNSFEESEIKFCIQTNGIFLDKLEDKYLMKLDKILISIDGTKQRDNENKGILHYDKAIENLNLIRKKGFKGEIIARMAVSPPHSDIYEQVMHLLNLRLFDSVHWQIDAGFYKFDFNEKEFEQFVREYNQSVSRLVNYWIKNIENKNFVKIYPFLGILNRIKKWDKETKLPCGAGYENFTITTNGNLSACPIMNSVKNFYCGNIEKGVEKNIEIKDKICEVCDIKDICGGRCLYWRNANLWPKKGDELICKTIKHLIKEIKEKTKDLDLNKKDFEYEKYFGPEIIP